MTLFTPLGLPRYTKVTPRAPHRHSPNNLPDVPQSAHTDIHTRKLPYTLKSKYLKDIITLSLKLTSSFHFSMTRVSAPSENYISSFQPFPTLPTFEQCKTVSSKWAKTPSALLLANRMYIQNRNCALRINHIILVECSSQHTLQSGITEVVM